MRLITSITVAAVIAALAGSPAMAVELTISRASSIEPVPAGTVSRMEIAPIEGVPVSNSDHPMIDVEVIGKSHANTSATSPVPSAIPIPSSNPAAVSFCQVVTQ